MNKTNLHHSISWIANYVTFCRLILSLCKRWANSSQQLRDILISTCFIQLTSLFLWDPSLPMFWVC